MGSDIVSFSVLSGFLPVAILVKLQSLCQLTWYTTDRADRVMCLEIKRLGRLKAEAGGTERKTGGAKQPPPVAQHRS